MDEIDEKQPNELVVTVLQVRSKQFSPSIHAHHVTMRICQSANPQARRLTAANKNMFSGGGASSDPLVQLKIDGNKIDSKVCVSRCTNTRLLAHILTDAYLCPHRRCPRRI